MANSGLERPHGIIKDLAESTALIVKVFSRNFLSDYNRCKRRACCLWLCHGALSKTTVCHGSSSRALVLTARLLDRTGKGVRGAPRDALVADITPPHYTGRSLWPAPGIGYRGGFSGSLAGSWINAAWSNDFRAVSLGRRIPGYTRRYPPFFSEFRNRNDHIRKKNESNPSGKSATPELHPIGGVVAIAQFLCWRRFSEAVFGVARTTGRHPYRTDALVYGGDEA